MQLNQILTRVFNYLIKMHECSSYINSLENCVQIVWHNCVFNLMNGELCRHNMELVFDTSHRPQRRPITPYTAEQNLGRAIKNNEGLDHVKNLVEEGADISSLCDNYATPLTLAAHLGKTDLVSYLLQQIKQVSCFKPCTIKRLSCHLGRCVV